MLRRARSRDVAAMHEIMSNPLAMRYWSSLPHATFAETEKWMSSMIGADHAVSDDFIVTIGGRLIGKLGCWKLPEVGFLIDPASWGKGYASEALAAFIKRRRTLGSAALIADVDPRNAASLALLRRHGFAETGRAPATWQIGDELCDSVYLALCLRRPE